MNWDWIRLSQGPSPRVRGSPCVCPRRLLPAGSIPACAGKPDQHAPIRPQTAVHPRVCGEAAAVEREDDHGKGPSPRVRGSQGVSQGADERPGSIPACAGKPGSTPGGRPGRGVHPRVCGEALRADPRGVRAQGPSPRVRGSRHPVAADRGGVGSIPACAGKPCASNSRSSETTVHPRVCGEAVEWLRDQGLVEGPSPRVRGSLQSPRSATMRLRSIPACAGKPRHPRSRGCRRWVHPRVCGEAASAGVICAKSEGPSPRVRGSPRQADDAHVRAGSIPACAGKPISNRFLFILCGVHPRVCGEAAAAGSAAESKRGPSPRVRGSRRVDDRRPQRGGSIPACAGKPRTPVFSASTNRVHPRVCGEACPPRIVATMATGPSPRVRGSRRMFDSFRLGAGSIPACAGKPGPRWRACPGDRVHPRVCGEAWPGAAAIAGRAGPSPRVRGSRRRRPVRRGGPGSIPACAGKPSAAATARRPHGVHPRVCGEAAVSVRAMVHARGPSPRVRGSPDQLAVDYLSDGSIPACAGKPTRWRPPRRCVRVHPRVCGEARSGKTHAASIGGPSPRVRGSPAAGIEPDVVDGSIPACAGKPRAGG